MPTKTQDKFRLTAKQRLLERGMTITALAGSLGLHRNTVSQAINHPILPTVRARITRALKLEHAQG